MQRRLVSTFPRLLALALILVPLAACVQGPESVTCPSGRICRPGTKCAASQDICIVDNCGDGIPQAGEVCDDGNVQDGDGCSANCKSNESCGNGITDPGEKCDDGNNMSDDGCSADCQSSEGCGNGFRDPGEDCDVGDGGFDTANCDSDCSFPKCGDSHTNLDAGEQCDTAGESATCNLNCTLLRCGDRIVNLAAGEECDVGGGDTPVCDSDCTRPRCDDGHMNADAGEQCDDGDDGGNGDTRRCLRNCRLNICGDGFVRSEDSDPETCDDGNTIDEVYCPYGLHGCSACSSDCRTKLNPSVAYCGDKVVNGPDGSVVEVCDDGNNDTETSCPYGDGGTCTLCDAACRTVLNLTGPYCGDGFVDGGMELCDDGNAVTEIECPYGQATCRRCDNICRNEFDLTGPFCGDGAINGRAADGGTLEACDDGNALACGTCSADCMRVQFGPATGSIKAISGNQLKDHETFTIGDAVNAAVTFEFDKNDSVANGHIRVAFEEGSVMPPIPFSTAREVALNIAAAIETAHDGGLLQITANADSDFLSPMVYLTHDQPGSFGNVPITENVSNSSFTVTGMSNGGGYDCTVDAGCVIDADCALGLTCRGTGPTRSCRPPVDGGS